MPGPTSSIDYTCLELADLARQARAGLNEAAAEFVRRIGPVILAEISTLNTKDIRTVYSPEDFLQETLLAFFTATIDQEVIDSGGALTNYVKRTVRRKVIDKLRRRKNAQRLGLAEVSTGCVTDQIPGTAAAGAETSALDEAWIRELVAKSLKQLSPP